MIRETFSAAMLVLGAAAGAQATEVSIKTLNSGPGGMMVFDPAFVKIQPGDTVRFVPTDKGHNAELIKGMAPEGAPTFKTVVGKEEAVTFDKPGLYGFKCAPHYIMGMVGLIEVGDKPENLEAAKAVQHGKLAAKRFEPLFEKVQ
ncbi:pseudoazurin [Methylobacterium pseudosasicola]|uniref:Pseudoazurin n=1 Tax=Methylobacterium pseudosasicola TaxID=582667 RepID=A0A1I4KYM9_9HYPH|nr:pseudoazurin [Methylobacterium pseudosasicola]SFL83904.1 pseudoazurin [Methylobacterium pseudosasicola]